MEGERKEKKRRKEGEKKRGEKKQKKGRISYLENPTFIP